MRNICRLKSLSFAIAAAFLLGSTPLWAEPQTQLTLEETYSLALKQSENLQRQVQDIRAAEARYQEAIGALYPNIHALATQRFRNTTSAGGNPTTTEVNNNLGSFRASSKHPFETSINVRQPIFSGFRDILLSQAFKGEVRALKFDTERNKELLYQDVADVFHQVAYYTDDLKILKKSANVLDKRIDELKQFIKLGKSRDSEIAAAQSDLADIEATFARVTGLLGASKELLAFLLGKSADSFEVTPSPAKEVPGALESLISQATNRADIRASLERVDSAKKELTAAQREHWPSIALEGNYYPYEDPDTGRDWDVLFRFDVPLYEGGAIDARIEQSRAKERSSILTAQENTRAAERDVRTAFTNVKASLSEIERLKSLLASARKNYDAQHRDYELGVVTNLEVLAAIRLVQNAERRLLESEFDYRTNLVKLKIAAGGIA
jgi:outer membrane protein